MVNHKSHAQIRRFALRFQFHFHRQDFFQRRTFIAAKREGILSPADDKPAAGRADIAFQYCQKALRQVGNRRICQHNRAILPQSFHRDRRGLRRHADNLRTAAFQQFPPFNRIIFCPQQKDSGDIIYERIRIRLIVFPLRIPFRRNFPTEGNTAALLRFCGKNDTCFPLRNRNLLTANQRISLIKPYCRICCYIGINAQGNFIFRIPVDCFGQFQRSQLYLVRFRRGYWENVY